MTSKDELRQLIAELEARVSELERGGHRHYGLVPEGDYSVKFVEVELRQSDFSSRWYWRFKLEVTEGPYRGKLLYANYVEQQITKLEMMCRQLGVDAHMKHDVAVEWEDPTQTPRALLGKTGLAEVTAVVSNNRNYNEVRAIR